MGGGGGGGGQKNKQKKLQNRHSSIDCKSQGLTRKDPFHPTAWCVLNHYWLVQIFSHKINSCSPVFTVLCRRCEMNVVN